MAKKTAHKQRPFDPCALKTCAVPELFPRIGAGALVHRFTVLVPIEQIRPTNKAKATAQDLERLEQTLIQHFGGVSIHTASAGFGLRDPKRPDREPEMNYNVPFVIYAAPIRDSEAYFRTLQTELQDALKEGVILIEKHKLFPSSRTSFSTVLISEKP